MSTQELEKCHGKEPVQKSNRAVVILGLAILLSVVVINRWSLERLLVDDKHIADQRVVMGIWACQGVGLLIAAVLIIFRARVRLPKLATGVVCLAVLAAIIPGVYGTFEALGIVDPDRALREQWKTINASEERIFALNPRLKKLGKSLMNLKLPDVNTSDVFMSEVRVSDLVSKESGEEAKISSNIARVNAWSTSDEVATIESQDLSLWRPLLNEVDYFEHAKFKTVRGKFLDEEKHEYEAFVSFYGLAKMKSGNYASVNAKQDVLWKRVLGSGEGEDEEWRIAEWKTKKLETITSEHLLFEEVLDSLLPEGDVARARRSIHEEYALKSLLEGEKFEKPHEHFSLEAHDRHPGLCVVDLDQDGYDDFYVMARWGKNMFFRNRGDGTFEEIAADLGLDIESHCSSAVFADFDNDGDDDLFVGRTLARSMYLVNDDGKFTDRTESLIGAPTPYFASSITAVDYNNDGLLDIYVSTYAARILTRRMGKMKKGEPVFREYFSEADADEVRKRFLRSDFSHYTNRPGPPNLLLQNVGQGRFEVADASSELAVFRNTYQSTWSDYDADGDMDVYLANDFAINNLLRNDNGRFVDVTGETQTADIGFGMGASWGDYDNDGRHDLYVANMFSKAGSRILAQLDTADPQLTKMAKGNSLFRNDTPSFDKVSGQQKPKLLVEIAGWSWGGQFVDIDNNGWLDLYALSGYYSAPKQVAVDKDL